MHHNKDKLRIIQDDNVGYSLALQLELSKTISKFLPPLQLVTVSLWYKAV